MNVSEIMAKVKRINVHYRSKSQESLELALKEALELREILDKNKEKYSKEIDQFHHLDGGLNAQIYNCMKLLKQYDNILPFLEKTLQYSTNDKNPTLWRHLGLLYLVKDENLEKAVDAWEKALALDSSLLERYPGLNIVYVYKAFIEQGKKPIWKVDSVDLESGHFSVSIS